MAKRDLDTRPAHSERVFAALRGPKQLIIVPDASHNDALNARVLSQIRDWLQGPRTRNLFSKINLCVSAPLRHNLVL
jgi:hypothetical protein